MSLILEALRKSEAERQRGRAPDLHTALSTPRVSREPRRWRAAILVMVLVGIALAGWFWRERLVPEPVRHESAAESTSPPPAVAPANAYPTADAPAPVTVDTAAPPPGVAVKGSPVPITVPPPPLPQTSTRVDSGVTATESTPQIPAPTAPVPEAMPAQAPPQDESATLRRLADLDSATRAQLPPLKVSMHVWNEDPLQRFALIDGQRLGEGAQIGDAVIERIERDGVVLAWRGERLMLPRP